MKRCFLAFIFALSLGFAAAPTVAQVDGGQDSPMVVGSGRLVRGTVTAVTADHLTLKTEAGELYQVALTPNTQVRKGRDQIKSAEIHVGDGIGAGGEIDAPKHTVHALFVFIVDAEQLRKARENLGKTYIAGTVTAINDLKLTILRPDNVSQIITVDEDTSFKRGRPGGQRGGQGSGRGSITGGADIGSVQTGESITLADIKVGEAVAGQGAVKKGVFIPTQLIVSEPGQGRRRREADGTGSQPAGPK